MSKKILWLDNDLAYVQPYVESLREEGHSITLLTSVFQAEEHIGNNQIDLLILDVMVPTVSKEEEVVYRPAETDTGYKTGYIFYKRMRGVLEQLNIPVMVLTVRLDKDIMDDFVQAGLPQGCFLTKFALRDVEVFLGKVSELFEEAS